MCLKPRAGFLSRGICEVDFSKLGQGPFTYLRTVQFLPTPSGQKNLPKFLFFQLYVIYVIPEWHQSPKAKFKLTSS